MDGSQAVSELKEVKAAKESVKKATTDVNVAEVKATTATKKMGAASTAAASKARAMAAAEQSVAREAMTMGNSQRAAAGQVGNLTAQFNDIGVMMAAGQNPLQLAIQQGTQISQVIGPMGAAGAVKSLKAGFLGMISPISIITIGSIAAAAAMSNWLTGADEDAETLEEAIQSVGDAIDAFAEKSRSARQSTADMLAEFGTASPALRLVLADMAALAKFDASQQMDATATSVRNLVLELSWWDDHSSATASQDFLGLNSIRKSARLAGVEFARNLEILDSSEEPATKLQAALDVRAMLLDASGGLENLNAKQREFYDGLAGLIRNLEIFAGRLQEPWQELKKTGADLWASMAASAQDYLSQRLKIDTSARNTLQQLRAEAAIQATIAVHGEGSVAVAEQRLEAERAIYQQQTQAREIADALKAELMEAWDAANGVANVDMAGNITLAADEAHRLNTNLLKARGQEIVSNINQNPDFYDPRGEGIGAGNIDYTRPDMNIPPVVMPPNPRSASTRRSGGGGGGGGASQINAERDAIERLIGRERERLEVLRETDPVLQEMARVRDVLINATDAEREAVEELIRERLKEQQAIELTSQTADFLDSNIQTLAEGMVAGGEQAADAWKQVEAAIAAAALQALLLGDGPWADLFGLGGDTGGLTGLILGGIGLADGGTVYGAGGNKDDKVPAWLSPGETVVTAKATRQYRPLLQAMNDGVDIPGLASGGTIGMQPAQPLSGGSNSGPQSVLLRIQPSPLFKATVEETAQNIAVDVVEDYDSNVAPGTVHRVLNDPRGTG
ncbi:phage tail length tape measure family protein [Parasedimentitalea marina]|nr:phage tail length tape measure family protein [Parasedimentitalea marina]